jgi:hypothetical protein
MSSGRMTGGFVAVTVATVLLSFYCFNPFAPPTGIPEIDSSQRRTPEGVIRQLVNSYEGMRYDIYCDLFGSGVSFKYYVPQTAVDGMELNNLRSIATLEMIDTTIPFIDSGSFYYFSTFTAEREIHYNLFQADRILFIEPLSPDSIVYTIKPGTADSSDSLVFDTVAAMVRTRTSILEITAGLLEQQTGNRTEDFDIGRQVFYLVRDPDNNKLWIIEKWFELPN